MTITNPLKFLLFLIVGGCIALAIEGIGSGIVDEGDPLQTPIPTATSVISQVLSPGDKPLSMSWAEGASYQIEAYEGLIMRLPDITFGGDIYSL